MNQPLRTAAFLLVALLLLMVAPACSDSEAGEPEKHQHHAVAADEAVEPGDDDPTEQIDESVPEHELVVVLHGMGRTSMAMYAVQWELEQAGYKVLNWGYSSTCCTIEELGEELAQELAEYDKFEPKRIHFVGHSLGNIIARWVVTNDPPEQTGKMVMLAPPNQGSTSADRHAPWTGWLLEPIEELMTEEESTVQNLESIEDRPVGVIAGEHDGKVSVEESKLDEQDDHQVVPAHHTFIMNRSDVREKIVSFLEDGEF